MKKIMFNDRYGLTKAVLEGRKTMTRRIIPEDETKGGLVPISFWNGKWCGSHGKPLKSQPYSVGEVVAVAQCYDDVYDEFASKVDIDFDKPIPDNFQAFSKESYYTLPKTLPGWYNKMFVKADLMPHQIRITNIRVERLQDISDEDCVKEGVCLTASGFYVNYNPETHSRDWLDGMTYRSAFASLIDKVSGKGTWASNPWVFVYEFELVK